MKVSNSSLVWAIRIVLDQKIARLTQMLFVGLARGKVYQQNGSRATFYFDVRGFIFLPRTIYFTENSSGPLWRQTL